MQAHAAPLAAALEGQGAWGCPSPPAHIFGFAYAKYERENHAGRAKPIPTNLLATHVLFVRGRIDIDTDIGH